MLLAPKESFPLAARRELRAVARAGHVGRPRRLSTWPAWNRGVVLRRAPLSARAAPATLATPATQDLDGVAPEQCALSTGATVAIESGHICIEPE